MADADRQPALVGKAPLHLVKRDVVGLVDQGEGKVGFRLDASWTPVAAHW